MLKEVIVQVGDYRDIVETSILRDEGQEVFCEGGGVIELRCVENVYFRRKHLERDFGEWNLFWDCSRELFGSLLSFGFVFWFRFDVSGCDRWWWRHFGGDVAGDLFEFRIGSRPSLLSPCQK